MKDNKNLPTPPLGAHTSISGGVFNAIKHGQEIGADVVQIFSKNQRQWSARWYAEEELETYFRLREETNIHPVMVHDTYLINLASPKAEILEKSISAFTNELQRTSTLKIPYLVIHPGSHTGAGETAGVKQVAESLKRCWESAGVTDVMILLETTAGQGTNLGYKFEHLRDIIEFSAIEKHLGVCIDTCHIFAAGYDMRTSQARDKTIQEFDKIIGLANLKAFHLNDSLKEFDSRKDRHTQIGQGEIGLEAFKAIINDSRVNQLPMILEVPGGNEAYREDLALLRRLISR
jgi:deoxyribonuclease-4